MRIEQTKVEGDVAASEQRVLESMGTMRTDMANVVEEQQKLNALRGEELRAMLEGATEVSGWCRRERTRPGRRGRGRQGGGEEGGWKWELDTPSWEELWPMLQGATETQGSRGWGKGREWNWEVQCAAWGRAFSDTGGKTKLTAWAEP